jgi:hypothetical protein
VCEILGRHWRPPTMGKVPVFNRNKEEYEDIFSLFEFKLKSFQNLPYKHYDNTNISFMEFCK